jgi:ribosomal protein L7/L12
VVEEAEIARLNARVQVLERQVDALMKHLNYQYVDKPAAQLYPDVAELKRQGKIIDAIKLYRSYTNSGLADAKTFVDNIPY